MTAFDLSVQFFLQMAAILGTCRVAGALFARLGQPPVVSEMIAGVLLGPSVLGWALPGLSAALFPAASRPILFSVAQLGLVLYMFLVGAEFDVGLIRSRVRGAAAVSLAGIVTPFVLGGALGLAWAGHHELFAAKTTPAQAMLFMGAAISITAFPMLARIVREQGLSRTSLGTLALAAGSLDDVAAWCALALVLASFQNDVGIAVRAIGGGVAFALVVLLVVRPMLAPLNRQVERDGELSQGTLALLLMLVMLGAWFTDAMQIYAVFGAFIVGVAMPRGALTQALQRTLHPLVTALLLPVFFVYSGLNTKIGLLDSLQLWMVAGVVLLAAVLGKGVACYAAARIAGESRRDAMALGTLMNARGLMELIILNIGLQNGIITPALFAIMVVMAIVTTLMATPIFKRVFVREAQDSPSLAGEIQAAMPGTT
ncbi:MAG TPA: cation:proton antiporter [Albitalea sp.]|nr:cation:proton antiporter [Albitalea sp.]